MEVKISYPKSQINYIDNLFIHNFTKIKPLTVNDENNSLSLTKNVVHLRQGSEEHIETDVKILLLDSYLDEIEEYLTSVIL